MLANQIVRTTIKFLFFLIENIRYFNQEKS